ncbi:MAG: SulP family inorganic anion transporter [Candidatus Nanopelagicales bacterium]|nr:SulP family inorganic anion transporter [Candidatus Nanopelagicales bacterium]MCF8537553.1 SulP family inorganic anion transporter [Candidatus Nanopelagicales bacterium]MCF8557604.1 SulP family inorganic anion transporter [Candidatus Nanopelagicales bacterium]
MSADAPSARRLDGWAYVRSLLPQRADFTAMRRDPKRDVIAGVTVAFVALPLALAFGVASGAGAAAGITTAIVAGVVAAVFGGSNLQISGPTGAMTVVLLPIVAEFGISGMLIVGLLAGVLLIALALVRAGSFMQYIPLPVVEGFTLGIAVIIGLQQVAPALGEPAEGEKVVVGAWNAVKAFIAEPQWAALAVSGGVALAILVTLRLRPGLPVALPAVVVVTVIATISGMEVTAIGDLPRGIPAPGFPAIPWDHLQAFLLPAVAVAALAALESLMSATVADAMSVGERHNPNRELVGQGMANLASPLFGGVPATAAIARTAVNVRTGARSRLSSLTQSAALLLAVLLAAPWVSLIPLAALAGVLIATVIQMVEVSSLRAVMRSTRGDAIVLTVTALATIVFDLITAVVAGLVIAGFLALRKMSMSGRVDREAVDAGDHSDEEQELLRQHVVVYRLDGPLFFGAAHRFLVEVSEISDVRIVILRMSRIHTLDATGASVLGDTVRVLEGRGVTVLFSGIRDEHDKVFRLLGVYEDLAEGRNVFASTPEAIARARALLSSS